MKFTGKIIRNISRHPFLFLTGLGLAAIVILGGIFLATGKGVRALLPPTATSTPTLTETPTVTATSTPSPTTTMTSTPTPTAIPEPLLVTFIAVDLGDAILIRAPGGEVALIDGGAENGKALAYLQSQGVKSIDVMIATLPLEEHIGGLAQVLDAMPVKTVFTSPQGDTSVIYRHFLDAVATAKANYVEVVGGDKIQLGSLVLDVLNPTFIQEGNLYSNSLVLKLTYGKTTFLFMGDANKEAENTILTTNLDLHAHILKLGQHGSCNASDPAFLAAVHPTVAVFFKGLNYPDLTPCPATLNALKGLGTLVYGTDTFGTINVTANLDRYIIKDIKGEVFKD